MVNVLKTNKKKKRVFSDLNENPKQPSNPKVSIGTTPVNKNKASAGPLVLKKEN